MKQVDSTHYQLDSYETPERFTSHYYQLSLLKSPDIKNVLEVGCGNGVFRQLATSWGYVVDGVDHDHRLAPSVCADVLSLPFKTESYDCVAAFQVLEHLPYENFREALIEMSRVCKRYVLISLPHFGNASITLTLPWVRKLRFTWTASIYHPKHHFDGEHYWEIGKRKLPLSRIYRDIAQSGLHCDLSFLNPYNPYHRFFILTKGA